MTVSGFLKGATLAAIFGTVAVSTGLAIADPNIAGFADTFAHSVGDTLSAYGTGLEWTGDKLAGLGEWVSPTETPMPTDFS